MKTETQKNFKKQMAQLQKQKERSGKENTHFFSYIENDHIEHYYQPKSKKKLAAISISSIISTLIILYSAFTWVQPFLRLRVPSLPQTNTLTAVTQVPFQPSHINIVNYLDEIDKHDLKLSEINKGTLVNFSTLSNNINQRNTYLELNNIAKAEIERTIISLENLKVPKDMSEHYSTVKSKYNIVYEEIIYCLEMAKSNNYNDITHLKFLVEKQNLLQKQQTQQLLNAFNKVGIKYEQNGTNINYWYKN